MLKSIEMYTNKAAEGFSRQQNLFGGNDMANCPKCGAHLKLTDWRPTCPHCGINLIYYGMEERLLEDADKAESEHAVFQKNNDQYI